LRDAGMSVRAIAAHLGHPYSTVRAWLDAFVVDENAMSREEDLSIMEELLTEARAMVKKRYRLVNAGRVVCEPKIDPATDLPVRGVDGSVVYDYTKPIEDDEPRRNAILVTLKILDRK